MIEIDSIETGSSPEGHELGLRLKFVRENNGLSQRELAKRAGVPHSSISMIEQGLNSPSINSLVKILNGIPMSISHFFNCELELMQQTVYRAEELLAQQKFLSKHVVSQSIPLISNTDNCAFERRVYAPNVNGGTKSIRSASAMSGYVVEGSIELATGTEVNVLHKGDAFSLKSQQLHQFHNRSLTDACVILICTSH